MPRQARIDAPGALHHIIFRGIERRQLFQNRYKSILCQEDAYLLELVRYIHLNPLRARLVSDLKTLDKFAYSGHSVIMGKGSDFTGGGLLRSMGGWSAVKAFGKAGERLKGDERIVGDSDFVEKALEEADEDLNRRYSLRKKGFDLHKVGQRVADVLDVATETVWSSGKHGEIVEARSLMCYWASRELGISMTALARKLGVSQPAVSLAVKRGEKIAKENGLDCWIGVGPR